jgi:hypothetical protein
MGLYDRQNPRGWFPHRCETVRYHWSDHTVVGTGSTAAETAEVDGNVSG